ncbi:hypothetical protein [Lacticaseibacillus daqingensis]|uniref:hypothetical protein n=1 Tax=Lacticaseibacillus daqingensis TaxID=2486014 RepID=UPI000F77B3A2|nr:hypothetical protein [Lacticaseibacillus daqingensis]
MALLAPNEEEMKDRVRALGIEPNENFLMAHHHNSVAKGVAMNLVGGNLLTAHSEQPFLLVFTPEAIVAQRLKDDQVSRYAHDDVTNFKLRDGADEALVIDFDHQGTHVSFYAHKDAAMRLKYVATNLRVLLANQFCGYATDMSQVANSGWAAFKFPLLESLLPLGLLIVALTIPDAHPLKMVVPSVLLLALIWLPKIPRPNRR